MPTTAPEPTICGCKSCASKIFNEKKTETVTLPNRKTVVTTWSCLHGHLQQTEKSLPTDEMEALMEDMMNGGGWII